MAPVVERQQTSLPCLCPGLTPGGRICLAAIREGARLKREFAPIWKHPALVGWEEWGKRQTGNRRRVGVRISLAFLSWSQTGRLGSREGGWPCSHGKAQKKRQSASVSWVRSSVAERLTADQQVPGSNPDVPLWPRALPASGFDHVSPSFRSSQDCSPQSVCASGQGGWTQNPLQVTAHGFKPHG